jgi:hypothetical protein
MTNNPEREIELRVPSQTGHGHASTAVLPLNLVAVGECSLEAFLVVHGG